MNVWELTPRQRLVLEGCMQRLQAEDDLRQYAGQLSGQAVYELMILATGGQIINGQAVGGDQEAAGKARARRMLKEMEAGRTPEV